MVCDRAFFLIRSSKTGRIMGSPVASGRVGRQGPVLCPEHISKTILAELLLAYFLSYCPLFISILEFSLEHISKTIQAMVMKFCGLIDLVKGECSAHEP